MTAFPELLQKYGYFGVKLLAEGRVRYFANLQEWYRYIEKNVDFMFGTRIHGNLISLLAGKPACVYIHKGNYDLRVRELAEFYAVPIVTDEKRQTCTRFTGSRIIRNLTGSLKRTSGISRNF